jgi:hypothetical protein
MFIESGKAARREAAKMKGHEKATLLKLVASTYGPGAAMGAALGALGNAMCFPETEARYVVKHVACLNAAAKYLAEAITELSEVKS